MAKFKFAVSGQVLDLLTSTKGIADGLDINSAEFDFRSTDWQSCDEKWAHFYNSDYNNGIPYDYNLVDDEISPQRGLNLPEGIWEVFVTGNVILNDNEVVQRYVTETQSIQILPSGIVNAEPLASVTPSETERLSALAQGAYDMRVTTATATVDDGYGIPGVTVTITGEPGTKSLDFSFINLKGAELFASDENNDGHVVLSFGAASDDSD